MLKLIIVDDERVIRETIHNLIDWESLGIRVVGLCKDGIEAYNMILDEMPDIVMADIRMPGLSGLELIKKIKELDYSTRFIILSGYEEFEYAREAMKYGVMHYLLKPCNEEQIAESIREVAKQCEEEKRTVTISQRQMQIRRTIYQDAMYQMIMEAVAFETEEQWVSLVESYVQYFEFVYQPYHIKYLYFLEKEKCDLFLEKMQTIVKEKQLSAMVYGIYVKNTLILYGKKQEWMEEMDAIAAEFEQVQSEAKEYENLLFFLKEITAKIKRYDTIYILQESKMVPIFNQHRRLNRVKMIGQNLNGCDEKTREAFLAELYQMIESTGDIESLRALMGTISIQISMANLLSSVEMVEFLKAVNQLSTIEEIREKSYELLEDMKQRISRLSVVSSPLVEQVTEYVKEHLSEPNLTLKKIAEEYLFMNVDYVGKQFQKATGKKFSQFLAEERVRMAKELMLQDETLKLQYIADQVGCGNNPQYFSQIFKKMVGKTPAGWVKSIKGAETVL